jgi:hypothetical protein
MERLAWRSSMKCERGVLCEKNTVKKKLVFSSTIIAGGKWVFNIDNSRCAGRLECYKRYANRTNLRQEMEKGVL